ncbi:hypothetical protein AVEN_131544-1 [Araneus ventricosus]|uniref:Uncharacterized protein n=1 Tax=Araneus ventricosus TaxID=182803 RepID=A0A4Y2W687_ARAVE|nr:hypothetical protein AVEN_131544-1 [Araneus ventricosus]
MGYLLAGPSLEEIKSKITTERQGSSKPVAISHLGAPEEIKITSRAACRYRGPQEPKLGYSPWETPQERNKSKIRGRGGGRGPLTRREYSHLRGPLRGKIKVKIYSAG